MESFIQRVNSFWNWFWEKQDKLGELLDGDTMNDLAEVISKNLDMVFNETFFNVGGKTGEAELTLSPEGSRDRLFLYRYWKE